MKRIMQVYDELLEKYNYQGWWPLSDIDYHPKDYSYPKNKKQQFEICIGAILTQNTAWTNVEKALKNLRNLNAIDAEKILNIKIEKLKQAIRPTGYFNQKAKKLRLFSEFFLKLDSKPTRKQLLDVWGIGKETADSILLYAYKQPVFVVDAYTRRIFSKLGLIDPKAEYDEIRNYFESRLEKDYKLFQEYHSLIIEHGKNIN